MNDVSVPWKRICVTFPEIDNLSDGRGLIDSSFHDLAMTFGLGIRVGSSYYGHTRIDHL